MMRPLLTPMTRAACTYSLLRSTIVEPRTVRAYCTQPVSEIARISTMKASESCAFGKIARPTPSIKRATRIDGNDSITSQIRMMKASTLPPTKPASKPRPTPISIDNITEASPTKSEMRAPYISADSKSRPWSSVPSRYFRLPPSIHDGGRRESISSSEARSKGLCGATRLANSAQKMQTKAIKAASIATGELQNECQTSPSRKRLKALGAEAGLSFIDSGFSLACIIAPCLRCATLDRPRNKADRLPD